MNLEILQFVEFFGDLVAFSTFVIGWLFAWKGSAMPFKLLIWLASVRFVVEFAGEVWVARMHNSNNWMYNLYFPLETFGFLYIFYRSALHPVIKRMNAGLLIAVIPILITAYILHPSFVMLNTDALIFHSFLLMVAAGCAFFDMLLDKRPVQFVRRPLFWLACGVVICGGANIMVYMSWEFSKKMILYFPFAYMYMIAYNLLSFSIIACFICIRRARARGFLPI
jgi:hypothetical protein